MLVGSLMKRELRGVFEIGWIRMEYFVYIARMGVGTGVLVRSDAYDYSIGVLIPSLYHGELWIIPS